MSLWFKGLPTLLVLAVLTLQGLNASANVSVIRVPKAEATQAAADQPQADAGDSGLSLDMDALQRAREKLKKTFTQVNEANPLANEEAQQALKAQLETAASGVTDANEAAVQRIQGMLSNPFVQKYARTLASPGIQEGLLQIVQHPNRMLLLYMEAFLFLAFIVFRAWRSMKAKSFAGRLWVSFYSLAVFWVASVVIVPSVVLGEPYQRTLSLLYQSIIS